MHEILTLQFGQQANFAGTHYWNAQESYFTYAGQEESVVDHDRSFKPGIGADGTDTYTPRALIFDLKGAFGTLRRENELYRSQQQDDPTQQNVWRQNATTIRLPQIAESTYQQALNAGSELPRLTSDTVRYWSDYNHVYYHPRSLVQLNEYELNSTIMPFERYETGEELFTNLDRDHELLDRDLRPLLEECDQLQGIQILSSTTDAWAGFTAKYAESISDELGKGSRWLFALEDTQTTTRQMTMLRLANVARTLASTNEHISLHIPLQNRLEVSPHYLHLESRYPWYSSALQAAVIDSVSLPARLRHNNPEQATLNVVEQCLNIDGRRPLAAASVKFSETHAVLEATEDKRMTNGLSHEEEPSLDIPLDIDLFPRHTINVGSAQRISTSRSRVFAQYCVRRDEDEGDERESNMDIRQLQRQIMLPYPVLESTPDILVGDLRAEKLACEVLVSSSERVCQHTRNLAHLTRSVLPVEEREALYESLSTIAEEYEESIGFSDDSDDDGD